MPDTPIISKREQQVLKLIANEYTSKEIADRLFVSPYTIDSHRKRMMQRWQVKNTAGLIRKGFQTGVLAI